jgi:hypothetical protein
MAPQINSRGVLSLRAADRGVLSLRAADRGVLSLRADNCSSHFQQISVASCVLIAEICIFLFFLNLASKFHQLLIRFNETNINLEEGFTNQFQREFDSNVAIATFDHEPSAPKNKLLQTICLLPLRSGATCCHFARSRGEELGMGDTFHHRLPFNPTNRIQREFLFNNCIQSQKVSSASKHPRQKTNFLIRSVLSLCAFLMNQKDGITPS